MKYYKDLISQKKLYPVITLSSFIISLLLLINYTSYSREKLKETFDENYLIIIITVMILTVLYVLYTRDYEKFKSIDIEDVEFNSWKDYKSNFLIVFYIILISFGIYIYMWYDTSFNSKYKFKNYPSYFMVLLILFSSLTLILFYYLKEKLLMPFIEEVEYDGDRQQKINRIQKKIGLIPRIKEEEKIEKITQKITPQDVINVGKVEPEDNILKQVPDKINLGLKTIAFNTDETYDYSSTDDNLDKIRKKNTLIKLGAKNFI